MAQPVRRSSLAVVAPAMKLGRADGLPGRPTPTLARRYQVELLLASSILPGWSSEGSGGNVPASAGDGAPSTAITVRVEKARRRMAKSPHLTGAAADST